jgi:hypothetical protein
MSDAAARAVADRAKRRAAFGVALVVHALLVAAATALFAGRRFVRVEDDLPKQTWDMSAGGYVTTSRWWHTADEMVRQRPTWAVLAGSMVLAALWYLWWRRSRAPLGRGVGVVLSLATTVGLALQFRTAWGGGLVLWTFSALLLVAAFLVAPEPADRQAISDASVRSLVRKHGKEA